MPNLAMPTGVSLDSTTASSSDIFKNKTAYDGEGNLLTGTMINRGDSTNAGGDVGLYLNSSYPGIAVSLTDAAYFTVNSDGVNRFCMQAVKGAYGYAYNLGYLGLDATEFGNASASDVRSGVTFTSQNGLKLTGTWTPPSSSVVISGYMLHTVDNFHGYAIEGVTFVKPIVTPDARLIDIVFNKDANYRLRWQPINSWGATNTISCNGKLIYKYNDSQGDSCVYDEVHHLGVGSYFRFITMRPSLRVQDVSSGYFVIWEV